MSDPWQNVGLQEFTTLDIFAFRFVSTTPTTPCHFSFPRPLLQNDDHPKRLRPLADVDGDVCGAQKKKRRLRLMLITSRLSQPYSSPPTHIVSRGSSKIAIWAKQKALGRSLLRKAAILNRIRRSSLGMSNEIELRRLGLNGHEIMYDCSATAVLDRDLAEKEERNHPFVHLNSRREYLPLPPSPLGLSNYDAFDNEEGYFDDSGDGGEGLVYSDFNILEPCEPVVDDHDSLSEFDTDPVWGKLVPLADDKAVEFIREKERQKEISFVRFEF